MEPKAKTKKKNHEYRAVLNGPRASPLDILYNLIIRKK